MREISSLKPTEVNMTFGKYINQSIAQVMDSDLDYLNFLALKSDWEPRQPKHAQVLEYIRNMFRPGAEQQAAARIAARAERDADRADLPEFTGRVTIEGSVISTKVVESQFGSTVKMLVENKDGWKVWGSIPASLQFINETVERSDESKSDWQRCLQRGDVISFVAKVEKSDKDPKFGFFSRPSNGVLLKVSDGVVDQVQKGDYPHITRSVRAEVHA